jgi:hypothetical protein
VVLATNSYYLTIIELPMANLRGDPNVEEDEVGELNGSRLHSTHVSYDAVNINAKCQRSISWSEWAWHRR